MSKSREYSNYVKALKPTQKDIDLKIASDDVSKETGSNAPHESSDAISASIFRTSFSKNRFQKPPQSIDAEMAVLGSVLLNSKVLEGIVNIIKPFYFYSQKNEIIYESILELNDKDEPIDLLTLSNRLQEKGWLDQIGGNTYLAELMQCVPTSSNAFNYAGIVQKKFGMRRLISLSDKINQIGTDDTKELSQLLNLAEEEFKSLYEGYRDKLKEQIPSLSFSELMSQEFPKARYCVEPFFESGTVNMVSAPPNTWKSWLLFLASSHIAQGTSLFEKFSTEQSKVMIVNEEDSFRAIQDRFNILGITDTTLPIFFRVANGSKFESKFIDKLLEELKEKQINVVIFDSLRSMHEADENDSTAMQAILDQMKRISRENITVIFTHHHRKKGMFEKGSSAESSRGSSAINAAISGHISLDEEERETGLYLVIRHLKSKAGEKLDPFEVKIIKENYVNGQATKVSFVYEGEFKQAEKKLKQAKDKIMEILADNKWKSMKDFENISIGKDNKRQALTSLKNDGMIVSLTRQQAIAKSIPVSLKGNARELYYSLNTENAEAVTMADEIVTDQAFNDF